MSRLEFRELTGEEKQEWFRTHPPSEGETWRQNRSDGDKVYVAEGFFDCAIERAEYDASLWLHENGEGSPATWEQEAKWREGQDPEIQALRDFFQAPPIAGYEALEAKGLVVRGDVFLGPCGDERVMFKLADGVEISADPDAEPFDINQYDFEITIDQPDSLASRR